MEIWRAFLKTPEEFPGPVKGFFSSIFYDPWELLYKVGQQTSRFFFSIYLKSQFF